MLKQRAKAALAEFQGEKAQDILCIGILSGVFVISSYILLPYARELRGKFTIESVIILAMPVLIAVLVAACTMLIQKFFFKQRQALSFSRAHVQSVQVADNGHKAALESELASLKYTMSVLKEKNKHLTNEKSALLKSYATYCMQQKTAPARQGKADTLTQRRMPFFLVAVPVINRLIQQAEAGTTYTKAEIQAAFVAELESFPHLKPAIEALLHTKEKENLGTPFDLTGWAMEAIRSALGDLAKKTPGPKKQQ